MHFLSKHAPFSSQSSSELQASVPTAVLETHTDTLTITCHGRFVKVCTGRAAHVRSSYHGSAPEAEVLETVAQTSAPAYATSASTVSSGLWAVMVCDGGLSPHPAHAPQLRGHCVAQSFGLQRDRQRGISQLSRNCTQTVEPGGAPSRLTWKLPSIETVGSFGGLADSSAVAPCHPLDARSRSLL